MESSIILRAWDKKDRKALASIAGSRKIWDNVRNRLPHPYTLADADEWIHIANSQPIQAHWAIEAGGTLAGSIGYTPQEDIYCKNAEIGYFIGEAFWGRGIATEAVRQLVGILRTRHQWVRAFASTFEYNKASMRVLEKNGFELECIRRKAVFKNGQILDEWVWVKFLDDQGPGLISSRP
jgi:[ribosomal protein S5]-alanine N-acetyltransferase